MKDMPMFTTENGIASLTLREIPYSKRAYIRLQSFADASKLLQECSDFCRAVGAEEIYAAGESWETDLPPQTDILEMVCLRQNLPDTDAVAMVVGEQQLSAFRSIYNDKMQNVPNAAYLSIQDTMDMYKKRCAYVVMQQEEMIGIGIAAGDTIEMMAALVKGKGKDVLAALSMRLQSESVRVVVASANIKAISLYNRLGFQISEVLGRWFKIL